MLPAWLFLVACSAAVAQELQLTQDVITSNFAQQSDVLADAPVSMSASDALVSPLLTPYPEPLVNLGAQKRPAWIRFSVTNATAKPGAWLLNTLRTNVEVLEIYKLGPDGLELMLDNASNTQRKISLQRYFNLAAEFSLEPGESATFVVRFQAAVAGWLPMRVIPTSLLTRFTFSQFSLFIFSTAGTGVLIFFNLLVFLATRDRIYILYTAATSALLLCCLHLQGLTTAWWFYNSPEWGRTFGASSAMCSALLLSTFARRFLGLKGRQMADYWYRLTGFALALHLMLVPVSMSFARQFTDGIIISGWCFVVATFVSLPIQVAFSGREARLERALLGVAWTVLALQFVMLMLSTAGVLPATNVDWYLLGPACFTEASLVAVSIALRVRRLQLQKDAADAKSAAALQDMSERARMVLAASHDARNLVSGALALNKRIVSSKDLVDAQSDSQQLGQMLGSVQQTMNLMVSNNRQVGAGAIPMIEEIKVAELFETLELTFRERADKAGKSISYRSQCDSIAADRNMVVRVLSNLIANAIEYSDGKRVLLVCRRADDHVSLRVYDQGPGLSATELASITDEDKSVRLSPQTSGVGVGLSVCRQLAAAYGAKLESASRSDGGSMFGLSMPLPDISKSGQNLVFVGEPELWARFVSIIRGSKILDDGDNASHGIRVFSEAAEVRLSRSVNIVACFDRSPENRDKWSQTADAILCFPLTLPALAQAISIACYRRSLTEAN
ncbi:sensor histidine kinase [Congregibacter brevis]|uniref:histidine kinase n=1 Tax=Congregibacter brevis TaxID=3081201 RepID=A0ABZ0ICJ2_9GAMM|nr:sensor histidine kinase [Congregibacter sp. IMCC45268]